MQQTSELELKQELLALLEEKERALHYNKFDAYFPDTGPFRRELYHKHVEFMFAGARHKERAFIAANRVGKTFAGAYEMTCHLTGLYPPWWRGRKFLNPIEAWASGKTNEKTREIIQTALLGPSHDLGSGMIPKNLIVGEPVKKQGTTDAYYIIRVRHVSGGISVLELKSYEQGRDGFEGTKKQVIWLDEEPRDPSIYSECVMRLTDPYNPGIIYCTFTPLYGRSDIVLSFLPGGAVPPNGVNPENPSKFATQVGWDEVPHITDEDKESMLKSALPHEKMARSKGIPSLGSGAIYPYDEDSILCDPFEIPGWWPKGYGLDVGWNRTAAVWGAMNPDTKVVYLYSEHYEGQAAPAVHASAIKARGEWMTGAIDPASRQAGQADGKALLDLYYLEGLKLIPADHAREAGILKTGQMLESGRLKVFRTLKHWIEEFRSYARDEKGKIIKKNDHLMDGTRYFVQTGLDYLDLPPDPDAKPDVDATKRDNITGY